MNRLVLSLRKKMFKIIYLANESNTSLILDLIIKQAKLKYNKLFINKLMITTRLNLSIHNIIYYIYIRWKNGVHKSQQYLIFLFLNSQVRYVEAGILSLNTLTLFGYQWGWIHFLLSFSKLIFCFSNLVFSFSTQPISCLALFSGLVFAFLFFFFFSLYVFQLKIQHNWEREREFVCFLMGQVNVSGIHIFGFLRKCHFIHFQEN